PEELVHFLLQLFPQLQLERRGRQDLGDARLAGALDDFGDAVANRFVIRLHRAELPRRPVVRQKPMMAARPRAGHARQNRTSPSNPGNSPPRRSSSASASAYAWRL